MRGRRNWGVCVSALLPSNKGRWEIAILGELERKQETDLARKEAGSGCWLEHSIWGPGLIMPEMIPKKKK